MICTHSGIGGQDPVTRSRGAGEGGGGQDCGLEISRHGDAGDGAADALEAHPPRLSRGTDDIPRSDIHSLSSPALCRPVCVSVYPSICLSVCLSVCLSLCVGLSVCL